MTFRLSQEGEDAVMIKKSAFLILALIAVLPPVAGQEKTADGWIKRGTALNEIQSYSEAIACFEKAISLDSSSSEAWYRKGWALNGEAYLKYDAQDYLEAKGYFLEAIKCFEKAIHLNPSYIDAYMDMADSENNLDNYEKSLELLDKVLEMNPNYGQAINVKGTVLFRMLRS